MGQSSVRVRPASQGARRAWTGVDLGSTGRCAVRAEGGQGAAARYRGGALMLGLGSGNQELDVGCCESERRMKRFMV